MERSRWNQTRWTVKKIEELRGLGGEDDPEFFQSVVDQFLQDALAHNQRFHPAVGEQDSQALTIGVHSLKGRARNMGAQPLSEFCLVFEDAVERDQLRMLTSYLKR